jgi:hypothetical protein
LGISISEIYNNLVLDVIYESSKAFEKGKKQICMSHKIFEALNELKDFNLRIILSKFGEYEKKTLHKNIIKLYRFYERIEDNFNFEKFTAMLVGMTDEILQNTIEGVNLAMARLREGKTQVGPMPSPEPPKDK